MPGTNIDVYAQPKLPHNTALVVFFLGREAGLSMCGVIIPFMLFIVLRCSLANCSKLTVCKVNGTILGMSDGAPSKPINHLHWGWCHLLLSIHPLTGGRRPGTPVEPRLHRVGSDGALQAVFDASVRARYGESEASVSPTIQCRLECGESHHAG